MASASGDMNTAEMHNHNGSCLPFVLFRCTHTNLIELINAFRLSPYYTILSTSNSTPKIGALSVLS